MYYIICNFQIEGFHCWKDAPDFFSYLRNRHRHIFEISAKIKVDHSNRQIEINEQRKVLIKYLINKYGDPCEFNNMSCEDIARDLAEHFNFYKVKVLEDGYSGAEYINMKRR